MSINLFFITRLLTALSRTTHTTRVVKSLTRLCLLLATKREEWNLLKLVSLPELQCTWLLQLNICKMDSTFLDRLIYYITRSISHLSHTNVQQLANMDTVHTAQPLSQNWLLESYNPEEETGARVTLPVRSRRKEFHQEITHQEPSSHTAQEQIMSSPIIASEPERRDRLALPLPVPYTAPRVASTVFDVGSGAMPLLEPGLPDEIYPYQSTRSMVPQHYTTDRATELCLGRDAARREDSNRDRPQQNPDGYAAGEGFNLRPIHIAENDSVLGTSVRQYLIGHASQPVMTPRHPQQNFQRVDSGWAATQHHTINHASQRDTTLPLLQQIVQHASRQFPLDHAFQRGMAQPSLPQMVQGADALWAMAQQYLVRQASEQRIVPHLFRQDAQSTGTEAIPSQHSVHHHHGAEQQYYMPMLIKLEPEEQYVDSQYVPADTETKPMICGLCDNTQRYCNCPSTLWHRN